MFEFIERWAFQRILKRQIEKIKAPKIWLAEVWKKNKDKIHDEIIESIGKVINKTLTDALENENVDMGKTG